MRGDEVGERVAAELLPRRARQLERDRRLGDDGERLDRRDVAPLDERLRRLAASRGRRSRAAASASAAASSPARTTISSPFEMPASIPPARFVRRGEARSSRSISSCACRAALAGEREAVADLDALDRLDPHQRRREPRVEPVLPRRVRAEPGRDARARTSTMPPSVSRSARAASIARARSLVLAADLDAVPRPRSRARASSAFATAPAATKHRRVPRARALERVTHVLVPVLEDARQVGVARAAAASPASFPFRPARPRAATGSSPTSSSCGRGSGRRARAASRACARAAGRRAPRPRPARSAGAGCGRSPAGGGARSASIASRSSVSPAGSPATIATSAGPCDSPAVASGLERQRPCRARTACPHDVDRRGHARPELERRRALATSTSRPSTTVAPAAARPPRAPSRVSGYGRSTSVWPGSSSNSTSSRTLVACTTRSAPLDVRRPLAAPRVDARVRQRRAERGRRGPAPSPTITGRSWAARRGSRRPSSQP